MTEPLKTKAGLIVFKCITDNDETMTANITYDFVLPENPTSNFIDKLLSDIRNKIAARDDVITNDPNQIIILNVIWF